MESLMEHFTNIDLLMVSLLFMLVAVALLLVFGIKTK